MAEELAFARKASGLTRGLSMYDAFGMGLINILPLYAIWFMFMAGLGIFAHANLFISVAITAVTLGIASPIVWGVMAGSMPRSGGDYVYNSRIIHPIVGMAASFGMVLGQMYWNIYMATWITDFFLVPLGQFMGWPGLVTFAETKWATFLFSVLLFVTAFCIVAFGMNIFKKVQKPIVIITLVTTTVCFIPLLLVSKATFAANWNAAAAKYDSLDYTSFIKAVEAASGAAFTGGWTWHDTIGAFTATFMLVVYAYIIAYVGGEIKRPDKSIMGANFLGGAVTVALAFLFLFGAYHAAESRFLISAAFNEFNGGVEGYNLPWSSGVMGLVFTASGFNRVVGAAMALTWLLSTVAIFAVILTFVQRVIFAWGMDRMGPKWFTDISPRYATPMKGFLFVTHRVRRVLGGLHPLAPERSGRPRRGGDDDRLGVPHDGDLGDHLPVQKAREVDLGQLPLQQLEAPGRAGDHHRGSRVPRLHPDPAVLRVRGPGDSRPDGQEPVRLRGDLGPRGRLVLLLAPSVAAAPHRCLHDLRGAAA